MGRFHPDPDTVLPWIWNDFSRIRILFRILRDFFSNILNRNFAFVFPSCKCVRFHIVTRYERFREFLFDKKKFLF